MDATDAADRSNGEPERDGRCCPYCGRECDMHLLGFFDRYGDGLGLIGGSLYGLTEFEDVLQGVRLAWLRADGDPPPAWVATVPALRFYFEWLGCLEHEEFSADEGEEDIAWQMAWTAGHRSLVRDVLGWLLEEECGWRRETSEWEKDDTPGLSTVYELWWEPKDPAVLADRLRERLRSIVMAAGEACAVTPPRRLPDP